MKQFTGKLLSNAVSKTGNIPVFNIPAVSTCPGRTTACEKFCYAKRHHYAMANVKAAIQRKYELSKQDNFVEMMIAELNYMIQLYRHEGLVLDRFRIHSSGDFYSQDYIDKWYKIIRKFPQIKFVAYTKSYMFDFRKKPKNLNLFYSTDETTVQPKPKGITRTAETIPSIQFKTYTGKMKTTALCKTKCKTCRVCYVDKPRNIIFKKH